MAGPLPYQIAVLCYLFDPRGRVLLLHRCKAPNKNLHSPIGGKLDQNSGESPVACAIREIREETRLQVTASQLHLTGIVSETGYEQQSHWLMFLYELLQPVEVAEEAMAEGSLWWHDRQQLDQLSIPQTDRQVLWPLFWRFRKRFFCVHIDCTDGAIKWSIQQPAGETIGCKPRP